MRPVIFQMTFQEQLKLSVRRAIAAVLFYSGINALYRFLVMRNRAVVLMYHHVVDSAELNDWYVQPGMYVTWQVFDMQMGYLRKRYQVVPLARLIEALQGKKNLPMDMCVLTFDDGWKDNHAHALPILKKYNLPATVFLVSDFVGTSSWFWPEEVCGLLSKYFQRQELGEPLTTNYPTLDRMGVVSVISRSDWPPTKKIETTLEMLKSLQEADKEKALKELKDLLKNNSKEDVSKRLLLTWDEVAEMRRSNIAFGSHTRTHAILTKVSKEKAREEILGSKLEIERRLSTACWAFCYPNGDSNPRVKEMVKEYYKCAFTTERMFVRPGSDPLSLGRIAIHNDMTCTKPLFACRISGLLDVLGL